MTTEQDIVDLQVQMQAAKSVTKTLAQAGTDQKNAVLRMLADLLIRSESKITSANNDDIKIAKSLGYSDPMIDRLRLDTKAIMAMAKSLHDIADLPDPVGAIISQWQQPSGLDISRVRSPLGVIGVIYESRPNVTIDAGALCFKSGNAVILRGGKEAINCNKLLCSLFQQALNENNFDSHIVQLVQSTDRALVGTMLRAQDLIDVIVPRGGKTLVARVMKEARVPVFAHLEGIVHIYIHQSADPAMVKQVVLNAKMRRTSVCGAAECLLVDSRFPLDDLRSTIDALMEMGCEIRADETIQAMDDRLVQAQCEDWGCEFLSPIIAIKSVENQTEAEKHIAQYSSGHTDVILSDDKNAADQFLNNVDSAIVMHNASSQFADGGEFGMGAEIGISTGKMHARGPVGLEQLTTFHYQVRGNGTVRP